MSIIINGDNEKLKMSHMKLYYTYHSDSIIFYIDSEYIVYDNIALFHPLLKINYLLSLHICVFCY